VAVKSAEHQARAVAFRTHQSFVGQRTQLINVLRGHLGEFGLVVAQGPTGLKTVAGMIDDDATELPDAVRDIVRLYLDQIAVLTQKIDDLHFKLRAATKVDDAMRRLCTVPGVGPVTAGAIMAFAPDLRAFASGRNFAAWLGLVPRQRSTGGKTRLGGVSKMGQADIRKLLIVGAMSRIRWIIRRSVLPDNWLGRVLGRKPRMVAAVALANKMARMIWAMMTRKNSISGNTQGSTSRTITFLTFPLAPLRPAPINAATQRFKGPKKCAKASSWRAVLVRGFTR